MKFTTKNIKKYIKLNHNLPVESKSNNNARSTLKKEQNRSEIWGSQLKQSPRTRLLHRKIDKGNYKDMLQPQRKFSTKMEQKK